MWNLQDDNELDKLSREAAEGYAVDRSPDSWDKLHQRLDAEMPEERRRRYLLFFLLFLFVGSGVFWLTRINSNDVVEQEIASSSTNISDQETSKKATVDQSQVNPNVSPTNKPGASPNAVETNDLQSGKNPNADVSLSISAKTLQYKSSSNKESDRNKSNITHVSPNKKIKSSNNGIDKKERQGDAKNVASENNVPDVSEGVVPSGEPTAPANKIDQHKDQPAKEATDQKKMEEEQPVVTEPHEKNVVPAKPNSRWTLAASYAPDISTVNFTHTQSPGLNIGLFVEYRLSSKFSLQSGALYTKKNYKMNGDDFHPPKGGWFDYIKLEDVTGSCYMIDFPLNVRFDAVQKKSSNIFFSAGLSSYLMKKEEYSYYYYYNGSPTTRSRSYEGNEGYVFSILNISAGFEKKLSNAFSLQVEPFFKQTLTGVGFGEISLNSSGVYFSVRYNPIVHKAQQPSKK